MNGVRTSLHLRFFSVTARGTPIGDERGGEECEQSGRLGDGGEVQGEIGCSAGERKMAGDSPTKFRVLPVRV